MCSSVIFLTAQVSQSVLKFFFLLRMEAVLSGTECMLNCCPTEFPYNVVIFPLDYYKLGV